MSKKGCIYCNSKLLDKSDICRYENSVTLATGGYSALYIDINGNGIVSLYACGDDYSDKYYPKYCLNCGRRVNEHLYCDEDIHLGEGLITED